MDAHARVGVGGGVGGGMGGGEGERERYTKLWYNALANRQAWCFADFLVHFGSISYQGIVAIFGFILYAVTTCDR